MFIVIWTNKYLHENGYELNEENVFFYAALHILNLMQCAVFFLQIEQTN